MAPPGLTRSPLTRIEGEILIYLFIIAQTVFRRIKVIHRYHIASLQLMIIVINNELL